MKQKIIQIIPDNNNLYVQYKENKDFARKSIVALALVEINDDVYNRKILPVELSCEDGFSISEDYDYINSRIK